MNITLQKKLEVLWSLCCW